MLTHKLLCFFRRSLYPLHIAFDSFMIVDVLAIATKDHPHHPPLRGSQFSPSFPSHDPASAAIQRCRSAHGIEQSHAVLHGDVFVR